MRRAEPRRNPAKLGQVRGPRSSLFEALETAVAAQENPLSIINSTQAPTDSDLLSMLIDDALADHDSRDVVAVLRRPFPQRRKKQAEGPDDAVHEISTFLIQEGNLDSLYNRILDAAMSLMSSDMASMQLLDPERNQLRLLAWKEFHPQSAIFWEWVYLDSASTLG